MAVIFMDYFWMDANLMNKLNNQMNKIQKYYIVI